VEKATQSIQFVRGDATAPVGSEARIIAHVCNDVGAWGKGFVLALSRRWPGPAEAFKRWYEGRGGNDFAPGAVQFVSVGDGVWVANMIAQHGLRPVDGIPPIRYEALGRCLEQLAIEAKARNASVHMPRIGCGLAGGEWGRVESLIHATLGARDVPVTIYDLE